MKASLYSTQSPSQHPKLETTQPLSEYWRHASHILGLEYTGTTSEGHEQDSGQIPSIVSSTGE